MPLVSTEDEPNKPHEPVDHKHECTHGDSEFKYNESDLCEDVRGQNLEIGVVGPVDGTKLVTNEIEPEDLETCGLHIQT